MNSYYALFGGSTVTGIKEKTKKLVQPFNFTLYQNYPNPFNPETTIQFAVTSPDKVSLIIYDILGKKIRTLLESNIKAGFHNVNWDGKDDLQQKVLSGVYMIKLQIGNQIQTRKMTMIK